MKRGPPTPRDAVESWYFPSPFANDNIPALISVRAFEATDYTRALGLIARRRGVVTRIKIARPREHGLPRPPRLLVELVAHPRLLDRPEV